MHAGADERKRQLALLRTIGASTKTIRQMVLHEGLRLGFWGGIYGIPLGYAWLAILALAKPEIVITTSTNPSTIIVTLLVTIGCALLASYLPARQASKTAPLDAMQEGAAQSNKQKSLLLRFICGLVLLVIGVGTVVSSGSSQSALLTSTAIALLSFLLSAICLGPCLLHGFPHTFLGPLMGKRLGLPPTMLQQVTCNKLQTGTATAWTITICLGMSLTLNMWGRSMVVPFLPSTQLPDQVVSLMPAEFLKRKHGTQGNASGGEIIWP